VDIVKLDKVTKVYPLGNVSVEAIKGVNLSIEKGDFISIAGPSGSGKTTILNMIGCIDTPTEGSVEITGKVTSELNDRELTSLRHEVIGFIFQSFNLIPVLNVYENIEFPLLLGKETMPRKEKQQWIDYLIEEVGLAEQRIQRPNELSGGQRQRVAMGRALVREPEVFLMDEPLSNLDAKLRAEMRREIARLHREKGTTVVYVTHDQVEAMTLADVIVVMHQGRIMQQGSPLALYDRPANRFVAEFIGSPQMNILEATARGEGGDLRLEGKGFRLAAPPGFDLRADQSVLVGVRPADLEVLPDDAPDEAVTCAGEVEVFEPMGAEALSTVVTDLGTVTVREEGHGSAAVGDKVRLRFPSEHVHLFDAGTEESLRQEEA
jgi:ABC-type sugar transport system ATPase subunit